MTSPPFLLLLAGLFLVLAGASARVRRVPGTRTPGWLLAAGAVWLLGSALEGVGGGGGWLSAVGTGTAWLGIVLIPVAFCDFCLGYTGRAQLSRVGVALLLVVPASTLILTWTAPFHDLMWIRGSGLTASGEVPPFVTVGWGPWLRRVHLPYSGLLVATGLLLLLLEFLDGTRVHRRGQVAVFLASALLPLGALAGFLGGLVRDFTPPSAAAAGLLFTWSCLRWRLVQANPSVYWALFETLRDGVIVLDPASRVMDVNPVAASWVLGPRSKVVGRGLDELLDPGNPLLGLLARAGELQEELVMGDGGIREVRVSPIRDAGGKLQGRLVLLRDITARKRAEAAVRENEELVRSMVEHAPSGVLRLRPLPREREDLPDYRVLLVNPEACRIVGRPLDDLVGGTLQGARIPGAGPILDLLARVDRSGEGEELEFPLRRAWYRVVARKVGQDLSLTLLDVTRSKRHQREMESVAQEDPLTGLLNRRGLEARSLPHFPAGAASRRSCALLYLDLDRFKPVNDGLGHGAGDELLKLLTERLRRAVREQDLLARLGGDEFVILMPGADRSSALGVAKRLLGEGSAPYALGVEQVSCPPSIGVALQPEDGVGLQELLHAADRAMYSAKSRGTGVFLAGDLPPEEGPAGEGIPDHGGGGE